MNKTPSPATHFRNLFQFPDNLRYVIWKALHSKAPITLRFKDGTLLTLRPLPASDFQVAYEIFIFQVYGFDIDPDQVRLIVDLGGNVGCSCLFWARQYPRARVLAFEPHPSNAACFRKNMSQNGLEKAVQLQEAAAGVNNGTISLFNTGTTDANARSAHWRTADAQTLSPEKKAANTLEVPMVDFFESVGTQTIDILKIDIEGGEFALLGDPRFENLQVRNLVMEYHDNETYPDAGAWCEGRLRDLGYNVMREGRGPYMLNAQRN